MSTLLEKALEKVGALPEDEQDAIASQISPTRRPGRSDSFRSARLSVAWPGKRWRKTPGVKPFRWTISFDPVADDPAVLAFVRRSAFGCYRLIADRP